jgi:hypothetical protein
MGGANDFVPCSMVRSMVRSSSPKYANEAVHPDAHAIIDFS